MNNSDDETTGLVLDIVSFSLISTNILVSLAVFITIVYHCFRGHAHLSERIPVMLSANMYLLILALMVILLSINLQTTLGDLYGLNFDSPACRFQGFLLGVFLSTLFDSFVVQVNILAGSAILKPSVTSSSRSPCFFRHSFDFVGLFIPDNDAGNASRSTLPSC